MLSLLLGTGAQCRDHSTFVGAMHVRALCGVLSLFRFFDCNSYHGHVLVRLAKRVNQLFSQSATDEILTELRPRLCMHDRVIYLALGFIYAFLPTNTPAYKMWMQECFSMWSWIGTVVHTKSPRNRFNTISY